MSRLGALVATALVGVARRPPSGTEWIGDHVVEGRTARAVLDAACLHAVARRSGRRPGHAFTNASAAGHAPTDAPAAGHAPTDEATDGSGDDLAPAPESASQLLDLLLTGSLGKAPQTASLIGHWVRCAAASGYRAPHHLLVPLLSQPLPGLVGDRAIEPDLVAVLGRRGRWLAGLNPEWKKVADGRVLIGQNPDPDLVPVLGDDRAEPLIEQELDRGSLAAVQLALALGGGTTPWSPGLSQRVVRCLRGENFEIQILQQNAVAFGHRLDSSVIDELQSWHDQHKAKQYFVATLLRDIIKHISTRTAITAAFAPNNADQTVRTNQTMREDRR